MAKVTCAFSGITFAVEHFPANFHSREACHPTFLLSASSLIKYYSIWQEGKLTETESYLLFLATLKGTGLVDWRVPAKRTEQTASLVANYMSTLFDISTKIVGIKHPSFSVPNIAITHDTRTLDNIKYWLRTWNESYTDFILGLKNDELRSKIARREAALEKLIKSPQIPPAKYAQLLAAWASEAGAFPESITTLEDGSTIKLTDYWQQIIVRCYKTESILGVPEKDIRELLEHCEDNIDGGSIFSHHLFATLEEGISRLKSFFGIDSFTSFSAENPGFRILDISPNSTGQAANIEAVNLAIMVDAAPTVLPLRANFASDFLYLKAKTKWDLAQKYITSTSLAASAATANKESTKL